MKVSLLSSFGCRVKTETRSTHLTGSDLKRLWKLSYYLPCPLPASHRRPRHFSIHPFSSICTTTNTSWTCFGCYLTAPTTRHCRNGYLRLFVGYLPWKPLKILSNDPNGPYRESPTHYLLVAVLPPRCEDDADCSVPSTGLSNLR